MSRWFALAVITGLVVFGVSSEDRASLSAAAAPSLNSELLTIGRSLLKQELGLGVVEKDCPSQVTSARN